jgi:hypothetical protein
MVDWVKEVFSKAWAWFIIAGAVLLTDIILNEHINNLIKDNPSAEFYLRFIQISIFAIPTVVAIYLAIKEHE